MCNSRTVLIEYNVMYIIICVTSLLLLSLFVYYLFLLMNYNKQFIVKVFSNDLTERNNSEEFEKINSRHVVGIYSMFLFYIELN